MVTHDPQLARDATEAGVDRILVDIEHLGKESRQHDGLFLSAAQLTDIAPVRRAVSGEVAVRIDRWHEESTRQLRDVLAIEPDVVMLPMVEKLDHVDQFVAAVNGRARVWLLLETVAGLGVADDLGSRGVDEVHVGLNDLCLSLGRRTLFDALAEGFLDPVARALQRQGIAFGFGGVTAPARAGLPVDPACIIGEHVRLGSSMAWLGRSFRAHFEVHRDVRGLTADVTAVRGCVDAWMHAPPAALEANSSALTEAVARWHAELDAS